MPKIQTLKTYIVTLHPKTKVFEVHAPDFMSAISIAEQDYCSGDTTSYGFDGAQIKEKGELVDPNDPFVNEYPTIEQQ